MLLAKAKSELSAPRAVLIELMQRVNFGRIEDLTIRDGEPLPDPPPRVVRDVKLGGENGPRLESDLDDFALKSQVLDLFARFDSLGNGAIRCLEVKHGLPFRMEVEEEDA